MYVRVFIFIFMHIDNIHAQIYIYIYIYKCVHTYICTDTERFNMHTCSDIINITTGILTCMHKYVHTHTHTHTYYIYIYIYIYIYKNIYIANVDEKACFQLSPCIEF